MLRDQGAAAPRVDGVVVARPANLTRSALRLWLVAACFPWRVSSLAARREGHWPKKRSIDPVVYVHMPKCGSSFATTLAHHVCGKNISDDVEVQIPIKFFHDHGAECDRARFGRFGSGHTPLSHDLSKENVATMFRDPRQRVMSGYYAGLHQCFPMQDVYGCRGIDRGCEGAPVLEYGRCVENCTANMLTGRHCGDPGPVSVRHAVRAVKHLGFVGLTEEWALSVCLWHAKFGGEILPVELKNLHKGYHDSTGGYDAEGALGDWAPEADTVVFRAVVKRFRKELKEYGVTTASCAAMIRRAGPSDFLEEVVSAEMRRISSMLPSPDELLSA